MKRGDVYWVYFDMKPGSEIQKRRPAVIISNDISNQFSKRVQIIPFTSNTDQVYPSETIIRLGQKDSKAMADQIMTVDKSRLQGFMQSLSEIEITALEKIIRLQLGL